MNDLMELRKHLYFILSHSICLIVFFQIFFLAINKMEWFIRKNSQVCVCMDISRTNYLLFNFKRYNYVHQFYFDVIYILRRWNISCITGLFFCWIFHLHCAFYLWFISTFYVVYCNWVLMICLSILLPESSYYKNFIHFKDLKKTNN